MNKFSKKSLDALESCDKILIELFHDVLKHIDCSIIEGHRSEERQEKLKREGKSKVNFPNSKHNSYPSMALDVAPSPIDWNDNKRFYYFAGVVIGIAKSKGLNIRWGGDWNQNNSFNDQNFNDLVHFELIKVST